VDTQVQNVSKRGDWYTVKGYVNGRPVSADIHAKDVDGKSRQEAERNLRRSVELVAEYEKKEGR